MRRDGSGEIGISSQAPDNNELKKCSQAGKRRTGRDQEKREK